MAINFDLRLRNRSAIRAHAIHLGAARKTAATPAINNLGASVALIAVQKIRASVAERRFRSGGHDSTEYVKMCLNNVIRFFSISSSAFRKMTKRHVK